MMPRINKAQAKEAALLFKDIIIEHYRNPDNMAAYIEWLHTQDSPDCIAELKRMGIPQRLKAPIPDTQVVAAKELAARSALLKRGYFCYA